MLQLIKKNNKKGISIMVGYVLLVSLAIIMGGTIFLWMTSYIPNEELECPDQTSLLIKDYTYNCADPTKINITLKNNGNFNIAGYFIHASNKSDQTIATMDFSPYLVETPGVFLYGSSVLVSTGNNNSFKPNDEVKNVFNYTGGGTIQLIEITPVRWQMEENKLRFVSCGTISKAKETIVCQ